jgi:hypothetical protein
MRTRLTVTVILGALLVSFGWAHAAGSSTVRWEDIVGILQAGNVVGMGTGQIIGGGQPWTTRSGSALVNLQNGRLHFSVRGLVLAGGNSIGTRGAISTVQGTLVCDTNGSAGDSVLVNTDLVPLSLTGDADFSGEVTLDPVCLSESDIAFVIRAASGAWIANGAVRRP